MLVNQTNNKKSIGTPMKPVAIKIQASRAFGNQIELLLQVHTENV
jgi:hypothetical protein